MENHYQSVIKNRLIIETVAESSETVLEIEIKIAMLLMEIDFTRNNVNDVSTNTAEECINIHLPRIQKQLQNVRAQKQS